MRVVLASIAVREETAKQSSHASTQIDKEDYMKTRLLLAGVLIGLAAFGAAAQDKVAIASPGSAERPRTIALISAIGDQFTYLRQKQSVGSNMEPYVRRVIKMPAGTLDAVVLRGLDRALDQTDPEAKRVYMHLNPPEMEGVYAQNRGDIAIGKIVAQLEKMPERQNWDRIIVVTPSYQFTDYGGMGSKLQGIGVYIQPLRNDNRELEDALGGMEEFETSSPDDRTKKSRSSTYIAPYSYTTMWILDAKTLQVLQREVNHQSVKLYDQDSTAIDVQNQLSVQQLAGHIESFVERSSARALRAATPSVTIQELPPAAAGKAPAVK